MIIWEFGLILFCLLVLYSLKNGAIYLPTEKTKIEKIIELAQIKPGVRAVDLGSGDGRLVIALAKAGAMVDGFEINPLLVWLSKYKVWRAGLSGKTRISTANLWNQDLSEYDIVIVFGMTHIMKRLEDKLKAELKPGSIVISNIFKFPSWPIETSVSGVHVYKMPKI